MVHIAWGGAFDLDLTILYYPRVGQFDSSIVQILTQSLPVPNGVVEHDIDRRITIIPSTNTKMGVALKTQYHPDGRELPILT